MLSNHLILCRPLLLLPSIFPSNRVFSNESVLHIRWPKFGVSASASILPMNIQDWFPLGWLVGSSCSPRDSQESFSTPHRAAMIIPISSPIPASLPSLTPFLQVITCGWAPCATQQLPTSYPSDCVNMLILLFHSSHSLPPTLCKSIPYVCVSIPFLQSFISIIFCNCIYMCYLVKNVLQNHETLLSQKFDHWFLIFSTRHRASHLAIIFSFNSFKEQN